MMLMKWLKLSVALLIGGGFIGLILYVFLMKDAIRDAQVEPPLILAADEPVKRHPEQPGGLMIPDQDKLVFDLLDENGNIASGSVVPEGSEISAEVDEVEAADEEPVMAEVEGVKEEPKVVEETPAPVVATKEEPKPSVQDEPTPVAQKAGDWGVQLGSVRMRADAEAALGKLANQFSALKPLEGRVQQADVKGTTSYRIQFIGLESRAVANDMCARVKPQPCLPVSR